MNDDRQDDATGERDETSPGSTPEIRLDAALDLQGTDVSQRSRVRIEALEARIRELEAEGARAREHGERQLVLETAFAQSSDGIAVANLEGYLRFVNRSWAEMHGYTDRDIPTLIDRHLRVFHTSTQAREELRPIAQQVLAEGSYQGEVGHRRKDGSAFVTRETITILEDAFGEACAVMAIAQDITDEKQAAEALRASEARFRALAENAFDLIVDIDSRGALRYVNPRVSDLLGYPRDAALGHGYRALIHPDDRPGAATPAGPSVGSTIRRIRHADGSWRLIEFSGRTYRTADDGVHFVGIGRDVTLQKSLEEERARHAEELEREVERRTRQLEQANRKLQTLQTRLLEAERLGTTEDLAGSVAHAINNPLAALLATAQMAQEQKPEGEPSIDRILHLAHRIKNVVDQTLQLFRRGQLDLTWASPRQILEDVRDEIEGRATAQQVHVEIDADASAPKIQLDATLVLAALVGVVENALDVMPKGGHLKLMVRPLHRARFLEFRVSDTGPGIPAAIRAKVFEPFFTTKNAGTGLGLAIANGVIRGHHGRLGIEDREGGGASITIELPLQPPASAGDPVGPGPYPTPAAAAAAAAAGDDPRE